MRHLQRFATQHVLPFVILAIVAWFVAAALGAIAASRALGISFNGSLAQSIGMLTGSALLLALMAGWGWLRDAGVARLESWRLWMVTAGLLLYTIIAYRLAFFGDIALPDAGLWRTGAGQAILRRQAVVGAAEELLFRGFLLFALVRVWGSSRRGLLAAVILPALLFGMLHLLQALTGNPLDDVLMTVLNAVTGGLWLGVLVLLGGSIWPAALLHMAGNAVVQLGALSVNGFDPGVASYAIATASELPFVIAGLWLLLRRRRAWKPTVEPDRTGSIATSPM